MWIAIGGLKRVCYLFGETEAVSITITTYCLTVWSQCSNTDLKVTIILMKVALRLLCNNRTPICIYSFQAINNIDLEKMHYFATRAKLKVIVEL